MNLHSGRVTQLAELSGFTQAIGLEDSQNRTTCDEGQRLGPSQPAALVTCQADPGAPDQAAPRPMRTHASHSLGCMLISQSVSDKLGVRWQGTRSALLPR